MVLHSYENEMDKPVNKDIIFNVALAISDFRAQHHWKKLGLEPTNKKGETTEKYKKYENQQYWVIFNKLMDAYLRNPGITLRKILLYT